MSFTTCLSKLVGLSYSFSLHTNTDTLKNALTVHAMGHFLKYLLLSTEEKVIQVWNKQKNNNLKLL